VGGVSPKRRVKESAWWKRKKVFLLTNHGKRPGWRGQRSVSRVKRPREKNPNKFPKAHAKTGSGRGGGRSKPQAK